MQKWPVYSHESIGTYRDNDDQADLRVTYFQTNSYCQHLAVDILAMKKDTSDPGGLVSLETTMD